MDTWISDNVLVKKDEKSNEYFSITLHEPDEQSDHFISVSRYFAPGRCDVYRFWISGSTKGSGLSYSSEVATSLPDALAMLREDLDSAQVVGLFLSVFSEKRARPYLRTVFGDLLSVAGLGTKSHSQMEAIIKSIRSEMRR